MLPDFRSGEDLRVAGHRLHFAARKARRPSVGHSRYCAPSAAPLRTERSCLTSALVGPNKAIFGVPSMQMTFFRVWQAQPLAIWQTMNVQPVAADIYANDRSLCYRIRVLFILIRGPIWPHATVRDDEERRCWLASKRGQTHKAQTPYTAPSAASAKVADAGSIAKWRYRRVRTHNQ